MPRHIDLNAIVAKLRSFHARQKRLPSFSELQALAGYRSKASAASLVERLAERRIVRRDSKGKLVPDSAFGGGARLLGTVQAGFPSPAEEELVDTLSLDDYLIPNPDACFLLKVSGDSMIDAGILPGDLVIVERGRTPRNGDIVVAQVDGDWTMKYFEKNGTRIVLRAANKKYPPIHPRDEAVISAVVVAGIRKYK